MKMPLFVRLSDILYSNVSTEYKGVWLPARPMPYYSFRSRFKMAWLVFTGKADAFMWNYDTCANRKQKVQS